MMNGESRVRNRPMVAVSTTTAALSLLVPYDKSFIKVADQCTSTFETAPSLSCTTPKVRSLATYR
jgi:hypothetical protein